jgi:hypothetical protein
MLKIQYLPQSYSNEPLHMHIFIVQFPFEHKVENQSSSRIGQEDDGNPPLHSTQVL